MFRTALAGLLITLSAAKPSDDVFVCSLTACGVCKDGATMSNPAKRVPLFEDDGFNSKMCEEKKAKLSQLNEAGCFDARLNFQNGSRHLVQLQWSRHVLDYVFSSTPLCASDVSCYHLTQPHIMFVIECT
jgi:hypothetical protein